MYIWTAIDVDRQLLELRECAKKASLELGVSNPALTLPLHISLKISTEINDDCFDEAVEAINEYFLSLLPFEIEVTGIERCDGVVWVRHRENEFLSKIHLWLVDFFYQRYGVMPHEFDLDFAYHSSLFVGSEDEAKAAFELLKDRETPRKLIAEKFIIGCSESGKAGEYRVIKTTPDLKG